MRKVLLFISLIFAISIANAYASGLTVEISKYEPYPAEPGKYVDVWIKVQNIGSDDAENVYVKIQPNFPFSIDEQSEKNLGTIIGGEEVLTRFKIRVDENAVQGDNYLDVSYKYNGYDWITKRIPIYIQTHDSILSIEKVYTKPGILEPGKIAKLYLVLKNLADSFLSDIKIKLDIANSSLPFAPINSTSEKRIYLLESKENATLVFDIVTNPSAESGIYKIPISIEYSDSVGEKYVRQDIVSLTVGGKPSIDVLLDETSILKPGESGDIEVSIINSGLIDVKFLKIKLLDGEYKKLSADTIYIGDLDSDDTDTVKFKIYANPTKEKKTTLRFLIHYYDKNNNEYTEYRNLTLNLYSSYEISKYNLREKPNYVIALLIIIALAIGYFFYKRKRK